MASEEVFKTAAGAFGMYGGLLRSIADEYGMAKALEMHAKQGAAFGAMLAGMIKERLGDKPLDMEVFASVMTEVAETVGLVSEIEHTPTSVTFHNHKCPIYDGLKMAGWGDEAIKNACSHMAAAEAAALREAFPQLKGSLEFRPAPDQPCVEGFTLGTTATE